MLGQLRDRRTITFHLHVATHCQAKAIRLLHVEGAFTHSCTAADKKWWRSTYHRLDSFQIASGLGSLVLQLWNVQQTKHQLEGLALSCTHELRS